MDAGYALRPLDGGFSGETFLAEAAGERTVVRIYADRGARRGPEAVEIDAAVLRLVRGLLPVPEVLEVRRPDPEAGTPGVLVTSYLPGERLDLLLPTLDEPGRRAVGARLGALLGRLAQMPFLRPGPFVDGELRIGPFPPELADLTVFVARQRSGTAFERWPQGDYDALVAIAEKAQELLDTVERTTLVHSDFNPKNLLVDPATLAVTGLLDWEFAYAGAPVADLGNLLRFDREPRFVEAVLDGYVRSTRGLDELDHRDGELDHAEALQWCGHSGLPRSASGSSRQANAIRLHGPTGTSMRCSAGLPYTTGR